MNRLRILSAVASLIVTAVSGFGQTYSYEWEYLGTTYGTGSTINVPNSGTFTISVFIRESGGTTLSATGMSTAGVWVNTSNAVTGARVVNVGDITGNTVGTGFTNTGAGFYVRDTADASRAILTMVRNIGTGGATGTGPNGRILLGDFVYTAGSAATTLTATNPTDDDYNYLQGAITPFVPANASLNLTPVPEPATVLSLTAVAALGVRLVRRRRALA